MPHRVLIIDQDRAAAEAMAARLAAAEPGGCEVELGGGLAHGLGLLRLRGFDAVLLDPGGACRPLHEAVAACVAAAGGTPVIILGGSLDPAAARRCGACGHAGKDEQGLALLPELVDHAVQVAGLRAALQKAEQARRAAEGLLAGVLGIVEDGLLVADAQGIIQSASQAAADLLGVPPAELAGMPAGDLLTAESVPALARALERARSTGWPQTCPVRLRCPPDRPAAWLRVTALALGEERQLQLLHLHLRATGEPPAGSATPSRAPPPPPLFQLISLAEVRQGLAERWPALEAKVHAIAERILGRELGPGDRLIRNHDGDYAVLLASLGDEARARAWAGRAQQALRAALLGAGTGAGEPTGVGGAAADEAGPEPPAAGPRPAQSWDRLGALLDRLRAARGASLATALAGAADSCEYVCARFDGPAGHLLRQAVALAREEPELAVEVDLFLLSRTAELLDELPPDPLRRALVDLTCGTLLRRHPAARYLERYMSLPPAVRAAMVPVVTRVPLGIYGPKLTRCIAPFTRFSHGWGLELSHLAREHLALVRDLRPPIVAIDYPGLAEEIESRPDVVGALLRLLRHGGQLSLLRGASARALPELRATFGFDLLLAGSDERPAPSPRSPGQDDELPGPAQAVCFSHATPVSNACAAR